MTEDTAIGTLKQRVIAACLLRNFSAVWEIVEAQVAINTALELRIAELEEDVVWFESAYDGLRKAVVTLVTIAPGELSRTNGYRALLDALYHPYAQVTFAASGEDRP